MIFPEFLYRLNTQDQGKQNLVALIAENSFSDAAVTLGGTIFTVPADQLLFLQATSIQITPGAGQTVVTSELLVADALGNRQWPYSRATTATQQTNISPVIVPPTFRIRAQATFSAGANPNSIEGDIFGVLVPRGSFSFRQEHP